MAAVLIHLPPPLYRVALGVPPRALSSNRYTISAAAIRARAAVVKGYREEAAWTWAALVLPKVPLVRAVVRATVYWPDRARRDGLNIPAMLKPVFDGMTDARVWADDQHVELLPVRMRYDKQKPRLVLEVYRGPVHWEGSTEEGRPNDRRRDQNTVG